MNVIQIEVGLMQNFCYIIEFDGNCIIIDPGWDGDVIKNEILKKNLKACCIILTHHHFDHVGEVNSLIELNENMPVYVNKFDAEKLEGIKNINSVSEGVISIEGLDVNFIHAPGHTSGSQCIKIGDNLFTGDTLFIGAIGRVDLPDSSPFSMYNTLKKISLLEGKTIIYPGHDYGDKDFSCLSEEIERNPFLRYINMDFEDYARAFFNS